MRGLCKQPGGKLVAVAVESGGGAWSCRLDGDFFADGADDAACRALIADIEASLAAVAAGPAATADPAAVRGSARDAVDGAMRRHPAARLVGADAATIATAFLRAVGLDDAGARATAGGPVEPRPAAPPEPDWRAFWRALAPVVVRDRPRTPEEQMALDERWAREVAAGKRPATLRFWEWSAPAVVVGRFQSIPDEVRVDEARRLGFHVVRRCTGGGAMVVEPDGVITYSLYAPADALDGVGAAEAYRRCDGWLVAALRGLGLDAGFQGLNDIASARGKIGGAAQRRFPAAHGGPGAVLHHTTLAYDLDGATMAGLLNTSREKLSDKAVRSARRRVDPLRSQTGLPRRAVLDALTAAAAQAGGTAAPRGRAYNGRTDPGETSNG
ncbi:lipoate--protein ligase family protein [Bifidobacterium phasiani]|uniref:Lipoate--protein ligase family protein n=1 Tax=Bifidobacterium phasiani TaxID=2834431 RepID=A0ABS6WBZ7_9BIFI|nr:lipoate--protein ligase family protein [Bifidobacterium phasiani]MBW3083266.1 lipoate--protein ligase family protein [Bifidobacterium phasiani]